MITKIFLKVTVICFSIAAVLFGDKIVHGDYSLIIPAVVCVVVVVAGVSVLEESKSWSA